jgi:hypothetical protein
MYQLAKTNKMRLKTALIAPANCKIGINVGSI